MFHSLCGQSHKTVSINHFFFFFLKRRERRAEATRTKVFLLTSQARLTARPHRLTKMRGGGANLRSLTSTVLLPTVPGRVDAQQVPDGQVQL